MRLPLVLALTALLAAAPAGAKQRSGEAELAGELGNRVAGTPVDCIDSQDQTSVQVIEGTAIIYGNGTRRWVNRLMGGADALRRDDILVQHIYGGQLCRLDTVTLMDPSSRMPHGFVTLGPFVPYNHPQPAKR